MSSAPSAPARHVEAAARGGSVAALVPAKDRADSVDATVSALLTLRAGIDVVVVDDGSTDATSEAAAAAGASVVRLVRNVGKGGAIAAGIAARPDAAVYLLVDADVGSSAAATGALLDALDAGADLAIGVLPSAGGRGGFGLVRTAAAAAIRRACGFDAAAPLSGQRAVRGQLLRSLRPASRFGLEVGMTIDAVRAGARVVEVPVAMDHRHTGRSLAGFRHRARQGADIVRAAWPRLTSRAQRVTLIAVAVVLAVASLSWAGGRWEPTSAPLPATVERVVVFGTPHLSFADLRNAGLPTLTRLVEEGAVAAMSVRTQSRRPSSAEAYSSLGAGARVRAGEAAALAFAADAPFEGGTAAAALERRTGTRPAGDVVVVGGPATARRNHGRHAPSNVGALGAALRAAGRRVGVVGNADTFSGTDGPHRPAAIAVMDSGGGIDAGVVGPELVGPAEEAPFGRAADEQAVLAAFGEAVSDADLVVIDPGDLDRAAAFSTLATASAGAAAKADALARTDRILAGVVDRLPPRSLLIVAAVTPAGRDWDLMPVVLWGAGVPAGELHSPSTRRQGLVTITDLAPTVLESLGAPVPAEMIGHPLRFRQGSSDLEALAEMGRDANFRERTYFGLTMGFIVAQAAVYVFAAMALGQQRAGGRWRTFLRSAVLAIAAWPLATFLLRAIPDLAELGDAAAVAALLAIDAVLVLLASTARRHPLSPLSWVLGLTVALLLVDIATGARLQLSSLLGYSPHTAARFTGFGNTAFATLAATTVLLGALHVHHAPRRNEAVLAAAGLFAVVLVADGLPTLGSDVGGILTLVPVFGLTLLVLAGRRVSWRVVAIAVAVTAVVLAGATAVDVARPSESRTHLGRLVTDIDTEGLSALTDVVARKAAVNFRTYSSPWAWAVVIAAAYMLILLGSARGGTRLLPPGSPLRAGVVGTLAAGLLGYAVNDSGVVVTALVFVFIGPFLTLVALSAHDRDQAAVVVSS